LLGAGDDLRALQQQLRGVARAAVAAAAPIDERRGIVEWDVGSLPQCVEIRRNGHSVRGYPALLDDGDSVSLRVFTRPEVQQRAMRGGVRRLLLLTAAPSRRTVARSLDNRARLAIAGSGITADELVDDCISAAVDRVLVDHGELPWDDESFAELQREVRDEAGDLAHDTLRTAVDVLAAAGRVRAQLERLTAESVVASAADAREQLDRLVRRHFVVAAGTRRIADVLRYVRGIEHRLERLAADVARDRRRMAEVRPLERRYAQYLAALGPSDISPEVVDLGWALEELRISVFAQSLGARGAVSAKRVARELDALGA